ncbi:hypothetical protein Cch01nite_21480 [Cellulomonas chitinilytica]|uniref:Uncharacterized protein n=1 Tax=Cellulomonas chitinilytica TaxID=398759 RepID=A0A919P4W5_9CELL|nr:hypothetical protein [Cellulomonas chitinilytica]GIG21424.1 hypothetical protein Cch01nite_21480 [Cellulomonas chitinilytica]
MAMFLHVFARSGAALDVDAVAEAAEMAWTGDDPLELDHETDGDQVLRISVPGAGRPITVLVASAEMVKDMVDEVLEEHDQAPEKVVEQIRATKQVVSFEVFPERLDDDGWEVVDAMEMSVARALDGLVVTDDGIYDAHLKQLAP